MNRRHLLTAAAATAASYKRIQGANERLQLGIIGTGNRGGQIWEQALAMEDAQPVAACDVYEPHLERALSKARGQAKAYRDFRDLIAHLTGQGLPGLQGPDRAQAHGRRSDCDS